MQRGLNVLLPSPLLIRDTSSRLRNDRAGLEREIKDASVLILCYAAHDPSTLDSLKSYWLPCIESARPEVGACLLGLSQWLPVWRFSWRVATCVVGQLPVLIVATKRDLDTTSNDDDGGEDVMWEQTRPLLTEFTVRAPEAS